MLKAFFTSFYKKKYNLNRLPHVHFKAKFFIRSLTFTRKQPTFQKPTQISFDNFFHHFHHMICDSKNFHLTNFNPNYFSYLVVQ